MPRSPSSPESGNRPLRVLALAYACDPGRGSEWDAGWAWVRMLARWAEVWVLTSPGGRESIEARLPRVPERDRLRFAHVGRPGAGGRPGRWGNARYLAWQAAALRAGRRLNAEVGFDVVWHLTYANGWLGSTGSLIGPPFVYGPVGGGVRPPVRLLRALGWGAAYELLWAAARAAGRYLNPLARLAWRRAALILTQNSATRDWLPRRYRSKVVVFPHAVLDERPAAPRTRERPTALVFV